MSHDLKCKYWNDRAVISFLMCIMQVYVSSYENSCSLSPILSEMAELSGPIMYGLFHFILSGGSRGSRGNANWLPIL